MNPQRPFLRSYWAIPRALVAGCYPGDLDPILADQKLKALVHAGVTVIVNLMEESERDHAGRPFADYTQRVSEFAMDVGRTISVQRFPIRDQDIPSAALMQTIIEFLGGEIARGGIVYVHCWGGKGRTATVVGCFLVSQKRETTATVLGRLRSLTSHASEYFSPTPQTS